MKISDKSWYGKGLVLMPVGIFLLFMPKITTSLLIFALGLYLLVEGVSSLFNARKRNKWSFDFARGVIYLLISCFTLLSPIIFAASFLSIVFNILGFFFLGMGILQLVAAKTFGKKRLYLTGLFSIVLGLALFLRQVLMMIIFVKTIGVLLFLYGVLLFLATRNQ